MEKFLGNIEDYDLFEEVVENLKKKELFVDDGEICYKCDNCGELEGISWGNGALCEPCYCKEGGE